MKKLWIDFDGTIANSVKRICEMYNEDYKTHKDFKPAVDCLVNKWNFADQCPLLDGKSIEGYFNQERFFEGLSYMENAEEVIHALSKYYDISIISLGFDTNLLYKYIWINDHMPYIKNFIGCNFNKVEDKAHIDMSDGILIDDSSKNLITANAKTKILYGDSYEWNQDWNGDRCYNWYEIFDYLMKNDNIGTSK